ncbi:PBSX family phage terminase large subunit [Streptomyces sp. NPDC052207]|uniref:PBSX family phage terminase large subunit n=1 Tax=Streptomyces sp. NPDC052207 TaxID=3155418 RepID=UPI00341239C7
MDLQPLTPKQRLAVQLSRQHQISIYEGSVRSAKTITSLIDWMDFVRNGPRGNLLMAGKTTRTIRDNCIEELVKMVGPQLCSYNQGKGVLTLFGRRIIVASGNDESSKDKIRGLTLVGAYCDELSTMPESFFSMLTSRMSEADPRLIGTSNPDSSNHWLKKNYLDKAQVHLTRTGEVKDLSSELDLARLTFVIDDNPTLTPTYVQQRKAEYSGLLYKRLILGEWCVAEGAVFSMFDEDLHVVDEMPFIVDWIGTGIDVGHAVPFAAVLLGLGEDGRLYFTGEHRYDPNAKENQGISKANSQLSPEYLNWLRTYRKPHGSRFSPQTGVQPRYHVADSAARDFREQLHMDLRRLGSRYGSLQLATKDVLPGINWMASLLQQDVLKIHRSCTGLIEEISSYVWDPKATAEGEDKPLKQDDHSIDAARYVLFTLRQKYRRRINFKHEEVAAA